MNFLKSYALWSSLLLMGSVVVGKSGQYQDAEERLQAAMDSLESNPNFTYRTLQALKAEEGLTDFVRGRTTLYLAAYFNQISVPDSTEIYAEEALTQLHLPIEIARAYRFLGSASRQKGEFDQALSWLFKTLHLADSIDDRILLSATNADIGICYANQGDMDTAVEFLKESIAYADSGRAVYGNYINIGNIYFFQEQLEEAQAYYKKALEQISEDKDPKVAAAIHLNLGAVLHKQSRFQEAATYFARSKVIAQENGMTEESLNAAVNEAHSMEALGDYGGAVDLLEKTLIRAEELSNFVVIATICESLHEVHSENEDYKSANQWLIKYQAAKDTVTTGQQQKIIKELEIKYETAQKEKEILKLEEDRLLNEAEISRQKLLKNALLIGAMVVLLPVIGLLYFYFQKLRAQIALNRSQEEVNQQKVATLMKEQEVKVIRASLEGRDTERKRIAQELHDSIGGTLASIKLQLSNVSVRKEVLAKVLDQLDETYGQVRDLSHDLVLEKFQHLSFVSLVKEYLQNVKEASAKEITFHPHPKQFVNELPDDLHSELFKIIQELLTNALKHAKANKISIQINKHEDAIKLLFEDDGVGFDTSKVTEGIGLRNIKDRLEQLEGGLYVDSALGRGTVVDIDLPLPDDQEVEEVHAV
ncbi:MAG: sensor histidine kinase [Bacteroidota bacterium]